jgi:hypothetical protein
MPVPLATFAPLWLAVGWPALPADLTAIAWLGGLVTAGLCLLYLIAPRRRQVQVPFSGLWQKVLAQQEARVLGRKWQRLLSLLLMVGLAALLLAALAEPLLRPELYNAQPQQFSRHTAVVVDLSASMASRDGPGGQSRLEAAIAATQTWLQQLPPEDNVALLTASGTAQVRRGFGTERAQLRTALQGLQPTESGLDLAAAMGTAGQMLRGRPGARVLWVSDGGPSTTSLPAELTATTLVEHLLVGPAALRATTEPVAGPVPVVAPDTPTATTMVDLSVEQVRIRPQPGDPDRGTLLVRLQNSSGNPVAARLLVAASAVAQTPTEFAAEANLRRVLTVTAQPGVSLHEVADLDVGDPRFAVTVQAADKAFADAAPWNDVGYAVVAEQKRLRVLLVSAGNAYLKMALEAQLRVDLTEVSPQAYNPADYAADQYTRHQMDMVVLEQAGKPLPEGTPGLEIAIGLPAGSTEVLRRAEGPSVVPKAAEHPLLRGVSFTDTNFDLVRLVPLRAGDTAVAQAEGAGAVMVARTVPVRAVLWGLDLLETDLPMRYAMPVLVGNALAWLAGEDEPLVLPLEPGKPWAVQTPTEGRGWQYLEPGSPPRMARVSAGLLLASSERQGIHVWRDLDGREVARPTALAAEERPLAVQVIGTPLREQAQNTPQQAGPVDQPRWTWWLIAALAVLAAEWWLYLRRRTV